ncbi:MAG TPA: hypothetical protein VNC61_06430 [Acidimicrobiales bacterium]|nr:hypothetical protein [Acidimicrobiales bacterium]
MTVLPDGIYDVIVVDAEADDDGDLCLDVTISLGPHVGDVVRLRGRHVERRCGAVETGDPSVLLGAPGTLRVRDGEPIFRPEKP